MDLFAKIMAFSCVNLESGAHCSEEELRDSFALFYVLNK